MKIPSYSSHARRLTVLILTLVCATAASAQSRTPEIKIKPSQRQIEAARHDPDDTLHLEERPYFLLIDQYEEALEAGDYEAAGLRLVEAMGVEPANPLNVALLTNLGMVYYYNEQDSLALVTLQEACRRSPNLVKAHFHRGQVLSAMGRDREAYEAYGRVLELDSVNSDARFYHGMMALYDGDLATAEADFAALQRVVPHWRRTTLATATLYSMTGRDREAISLYRKLIELERMPEYYAALAGCLLAVDDLSEASRVIGDALSMFPNDPELYYYRAVLNERRYLHDDAHRDAKRAIELGANPQRVQRIFIPKK